jgi:hypothetical protein
MSWADASKGIPAFVYFFDRNRNDCLLVTHEGDILLTSHVKQSTDNVKLMRLCMRIGRGSSILLVDSIDKCMHQELTRIRNSWLRHNEIHEISTQLSLPNINFEQSIYFEKAKKDENFLLTSKNLNLFKKPFLLKFPLRRKVHSHMNCCIEKNTKFVSGIPHGLRSLYARTIRMFHAMQSRIPRIVMYLSSEHKEAKVIDNAMRASQAGVKHVSNPTEGKKSPAMSCKCMLMNNFPLSDFCIQWANGAKLSYTLKDGTALLSYPVSHIVNSGYEGKYTNDDSLTEVDDSTFGQTLSACESYHSLRTEGRVTPNSIAKVKKVQSFAHWQGKLSNPLNESKNDDDFPLLKSADHVPVHVREYLDIAQGALRKCLSEDNNIRLNNMKSESVKGRLGPHVITC